MPHIYKMDVRQLTPCRFLLPALHISMVLEQPTIAARRGALEVLPSELDDAYGQTIQRIQTSSSLANLGVRVFMWLHLATHPLKLAELQHALAVVLVQGKRGNVDLDEDQIPKPKRILDCCLGLVIVDEETLTVRFVHYTLEEYFKTNFDMYFPNGHSTAAEVCLTYLNFDKLTASSNCLTPDDMKQRIEQWPFLEYAACQWGHYARRQSNSRVMEYFLKLRQKVSEQLPHIALETLFHYTVWEPYPWDGRSLFLDAHAVAYFGLDAYVTTLANDENWNKKDIAGRTPIAVAATEGYEAVVRLLMEREDVDINSKDKYGYTPLAQAAIEGHEAIVRLLLERENVDVNSKDEDGDTPLACAAMNGHEAVVWLLLEWEGVDVNPKNEDGYTPLAQAAIEGHEAIVRLLLEREDVNINSKDKYGCTPLVCAARNEHEAVVCLLLEREDLDVNSKTESDHAPLALAARKGHEAMVRLLLGREDVDVNSKDECSYTPLAWAASNGHEAVVRLLLEREDVGINSKDTYGYTPLACAASNGHEAVVRLLLEREDVDVNSKDEDGHTPLACAAGNGHEAVVRLLLEREDVDVNSKNEHGYTPLTWAVRSRYGSIENLLKQHGAVDTRSLVDMDPDSDSDDFM